MTILFLSSFLASALVSQASSVGTQVPEFTSIDAAILAANFHPPVLKATLPFLRSVAKIENSNLIVELHPSYILPEGLHDAPQGTRGMRALAASMKCHLVIGQKTIQLLRSDANAARHSAAGLSVSDWTRSLSSEQMSALTSNGLSGESLSEGQVDTLAQWYGAHHAFGHVIISEPEKLTVNVAAYMRVTNATNGRTYAIPSDQPAPRIDTVPTKSLPVVLPLNIRTRGGELNFGDGGIYTLSVLNQKAADTLGVAYRFDPSFETSLYFISGSYNGEEWSEVMETMCASQAPVRTSSNDLKAVRTLVEALKPKWEAQLGSRWSLEELRKGIRLTIDELIAIRPDWEAALKRNEEKGTTTVHVMPRIVVAIAMPGLRPGLPKQPGFMIVNRDSFTIALPPQ